MKSAQSMNPTQKKILIVDDEVIILESFQLFFETMGYRACTAASAEQALAVLESESFPVILIDLSMPIMNGFQLCHEIHNRNIPARLIAITGQTLQFESPDYCNAGFDACFSKPVSLPLLLDKIEGML